jgi:outer membrane protein assembly factor BamB/orotate phosphoribosyltransferase
VTASNSSVRDHLRVQIQNAIKFGVVGNKHTYDNREMVFTGDGLNLAADCLREILAPENPDAIACAGVGGLPLASALKTRSPPAVSVHHVRDAPKDHNLRKLVEGPPLRPGARVWVVDDLLNTGKTFDRVAAGLRELDPTVAIAGIAVLVDFEAWGHKRLIAQGYQVRSIFTEADLNFVVRASAPAPDIKRLWGNLGVASTRNNFIRSIPAIAGNKLVVGTDRTGWQCLERLTGEVFWSLASTKPNSKGAAGIPVIVENSVIVSAYDGVLRRLDLDTGEPIWQNKIDSFCHSSPIVHEGRIFVGTEGRKRKGQFGDIVCLDLDGHELWRHKTKEQVPCTPLVEGGLVVCASNDRSVYALSTDGEHRWTLPTGEFLKGHFGLGQHIYGGSNEGNLFAFDREGGIVWKRKLGTSLHHIRPFVRDGLVIVPLAEDTIAALDEQTGDVRWFNRQPFRPAWSVTPFEGGFLIVSRRGDLSKISSTGETIWTERIIKDAAINQPVVVDGDLVFVVTDRKGLLAFHLG